MTVGRKLAICFKKMIPTHYIVKHEEDHFLITLSTNCFY